MPRFVTRDTEVVTMLYPPIEGAEGYKEGSAMCKVEVTDPKEKRDWQCTRIKGHDGPHAAHHGLSKTSEGIVAWFEDDKDLPEGEVPLD